MFFRSRKVHLRQLLCHWLLACSPAKAPACGSPKLMLQQFYIYLSIDRSIELSKDNTMYIIYILYIYRYQPYHISIHLPTYLPTIYQSIQYAHQTWHTFAEDCTSWDHT